MTSAGHSAWPALACAQAVTVTTEAQLASLARASGSFRPFNARKGPLSWGVYVFRTGTPNPRCETLMLGARQPERV